MRESLERAILPALRKTLMNITASVRLVILHEIASRKALAHAGSVSRAHGLREHRPAATTVAGVAETSRGFASRAQGRQSSSLVDAAVNDHGSSEPSWASPSAYLQNG
jgi:hypothetical protein